MVASVFSHKPRNALTKSEVQMKDLFGFLLYQTEAGLNNSFGAPGKSDACLLPCLLIFVILMLHCFRKVNVDCFEFVMLACNAIIVIFIPTNY